METHPLPELHEDSTPREVVEALLLNVGHHPRLVPTPDLVDALEQVPEPVYERGLRAIYTATEMETGPDRSGPPAQALAHIRERAWELCGLGEGVI